MKEIESKSCIKFRQFDPSKDENYLAIVTFPSRCSSHVGLDPSEQPGYYLFNESLTNSDALLLTN